MVSPTSFPHRLFAVLFAALSLSILPSVLRAEAPMAKTQAPGYYRMMLGQFEVTALLDGSVTLDAALLRNTSEAEIQTLLARQFIDNPHKIPSSVNAYLINTGQKLILVDAGGGNLCGPAMGNLPKNLKAAGYEPDQVDAVLITHLHPDHVAGILDPAGKPAFPNAVVYVAKPESDYWLSTADPQKAPPEYRQHLEGAIKLIRKAADPYLASGQWKTFSGAELPLAGVRAVAIPGHTPGHTAYEFTSGDQSLVVIGDMVHSAAVQFPRPDVAVSFDSDPKQAVATRETLFRRVAAQKTLIAGMHLPFPGLGRLRPDGENAYTWVPVEYSPLQK
jgi:glyoxylase-like metal-dependent hydrolase (beta-lactamase superfamily II)